MTVERFDKWLSNNFYPAIAGLCPSLEGYKMTGCFHLSTQWSISEGDCIRHHEQSIPDWQIGFVKTTCLSFSNGLSCS